MPVNLVCPNLKCKTMLAVADSMRGKQVVCNNCGQVILVPHKAAPPRK
jgi:DNA-directed RNA polymerase subunit RPC12/RpoP